MEQHPIPQNISSYEFRLVGDMTLKQFFQLAGGIIIGLIIFRLPLPPLLKYPMVGLSVLSGILMAFVPINGRPFSNWLVAFVRAIYSPTDFVWRPDTTPPPTTLPPTSPIPTPVSSPTTPTTPTPVKIATQIDSSRVVSTAPIAPSPIQPNTPLAPNSSQTGYLKVEKENGSPTTDSLSHPTPTSSLNTLTPGVEENVLPTASASVTTPDANQNVSGPIVHITTDSLQPSPNKTAPPTATTTNQVMAPSFPNILTGLVTDAQGATLEGAIVEILDTQSGIPARALRTNRTGVFQIATALAPGSYTINVEKDGYSFDPTSITVANAIIPPVIVKAKLADVPNKT